MKWSETQDAKQEGKRKPIQVKVALLDDHPERFILFQSGGTQLPTMWTLFDATTQTQHYLYGHEWEGAQQVAADRIRSILAGET